MYEKQKEIRQTITEITAQAGTLIMRMRHRNREWRDFLQPQGTNKYRTESELQVRRCRADKSDGTDGAWVPTDEETYRCLNEEATGKNYKSKQKIRNINRKKKRKLEGQTMKTAPDTRS